LMVVPLTADVSAVRLTGCSSAAADDVNDEIGNMPLSKVGLPHL